MVAIKNVFFAASTVASVLAAPATVSKRQDWGNGGGQMGAWGGQQGGQQGGQSWGGQQGGSQGQGSQGQDSSASGSDNVASVPIAEDGQSSGNGQSSGSDNTASVPIAEDGQSSGQSSGADQSAGSSAGNSSEAATTDSSASGSAPAAVDGETITTSGTGQTGDYYYSHWVENDSGASMTLGDSSYSLEWTEGSGNIVSGIGWNPASARTVTYDANIQASGNWYLALYGWTTSPLIEFYVVESYGSYDPSSAASAVGTAEIDGGTYTLLQTTRENQPSIEGTSTFQQYWAVRNEHRTSGSIDFGAHIDAWAGAGLDLGSFDYMIMATEGYQSSGTSTVSLS